MLECGDLPILLFGIALPEKEVNSKHRAGKKLHKHSVYI